MVGRPPKPTKQKRIEGNPGKRPLPTGEPLPSGAPEMPRGLRTHYPLVAKVWDQVVEALEDTGVLTAADSGALRLMAQHYALAIEAMSDIRGEGLTRLDENGVERKNPKLQIFRDNSKLFLQYSDRLGLTPSARARLHVEPQAKQLSLAELLFQAVDEG